MNAQTISGPNVICSGSSSYFTASSFPSGYQWVASTNLSLSSTTTQNTSITVTGSGTTGWIKLLNSSGVQTDYKNLWIGAPSIYISGPSSTSVNYTVYFYANGTSSYDMGITGYQWQIQPTPSYFYNGGSYVSAEFSSVNTYKVSCRATNACGTTSWVDHYIDVSLRSRVYPNPADDIINIEVDSNNNAKTQGAILNYDIRLYNALGNLSRQTGNKGNGTVQIDVSNLPDDIYSLHIYDGVSSTPEVHKIIVTH